MKVRDIRSIETKDLLVKVEEFKKELFSLRFQQATGQLENTARIKEVRKSIAKIKTVIRERELEKKERDYGKKYQISLYWHSHLY